MLLNTDAERAEATGLVDVLGGLVSRARTAGGVIVLMAAPVPHDAPPSPESVFGVGDDELGLVSASADGFDGVDELAEGLHDLAVDRIIVGGVDVQESVLHTAMAALACNFDVIVLADATRDYTGAAVGWLDSAAESGAMVKATGDVWLRM